MCRQRQANRQTGTEILGITAAHTVPAKIWHWGKKPGEVYSANSFTDRATTVDYWFKQQQCSSDGQISHAK